MGIRVETRKYEASHGRSPRGRGVWLFSFIRDGEPIVTPRRKGGEPFHRSPYGTYTEARKWAVKHARAAGAEAVRVLP